MPIILSPSSRMISLVLAFGLKKKPAASTNLSSWSKNSIPCKAYTCTTEVSNFFPVNWNLGDILLLGDDWSFSKNSRILILLTTVSSGKRLSSSKMSSQGYWVVSPFYMTKLKLVSRLWCITPARGFSYDKVTGNFWSIVTAMCLHFGSESSVILYWSYLTGPYVFII